MSLVVHTCEARITPEGEVFFTMKDIIPDDIAKLCGKPAEDFIGYGENHIWMCAEHLEKARLGGNQ